ncbi:MAG TPA: enoyl-CoA hydratase, partial [Nevskiaceae bacterium]|nr:enoyl-CoA hydratase [Nevskiaceae bacterium]
LQDRVLTVRFNRPDKKNALTQAMYSGAAEAFADAKSNAQVRVVLIAGAPDCFCAGNDIVDFLNSPPGDENSPVARFMHTLSALDKPVIAAASGLAIGIGVTLLLHCDLVFLGEKTRLEMPFVNLGICPEFASSYLLPRVMGYQRAGELLLCGAFDAQKARDYGIANFIAPNAEVEAQARARALSIAQLPPNAVRVTKGLLRRWSETTAKEAMAAEVQNFMPMLRQPEALEALNAFTQKRKPDFSRFS